MYLVYFSMLNARKVIVIPTIMPMDVSHFGKVNIIPCAEAVKLGLKVTCHVSLDVKVIFIVINWCISFCVRMLENMA